MRVLDVSPNGQLLKVESQCTCVVHRSQLQKTGRLSASAPLAQLAEHRTLNPQVLGSSPRGRTKNSCHLGVLFKQDPVCC